MTRVAIMGSGSWGTAFAMVLADAGSDVVIWGRDGGVADDINRRHRNDGYHPGIDLPERIVATTDPGTALADASLVVLAVPAQVLRENLGIWGADIASDAVLVSLMKGIELGTTKRMSEVISESANVDTARVAVVSGPNLAREIVIGTEIGGAVKNVIALANGIAVGMGLGENSQASLITRGLAEMARLGVALGADPLTFQGLAGVGDLVATCQSPLSRNRTFGVNLGQGLSVEETIAVTKQTCEGFKSCQPILDLGHAHGVDMPITEQVVQVVHHGQSPRMMASAFMSRGTKGENRMTE